MGSDQKSGLRCRCLVPCKCRTGPEIQLMEAGQGVSGPPSRQVSPVWLWPQAHRAPLPQSEPRKNSVQGHGSPHDMERGPQQQALQRWRILSRTCSHEAFPEGSATSWVIFTPFDPLLTVKVACIHHSALHEEPALLRVQHRAVWDTLWLLPRQHPTACSCLQPANLHSCLKAR